MMRLRKKTTIALILALILGLALYGAAVADSGAGDPPIVITFFWRDGCSHCAAEKPFLQELIAQYPQIDLHAYEVRESEANLNYLFALGDAMGFETSGVPVTIIGEQSWVGFGDETGPAISAAVAACAANGCGDPAEQYGLDTSGAVRSLQQYSSQEEAKSEDDSNFPYWALAAVAVVVVAYGVGSLMRRNDKSAKKRH